MKAHYMNKETKVNAVRRYIVESEVDKFVDAGFTATGKTDTRNGVKRIQFTIIPNLPMQVYESLDEVTDKAEALSMINRQYRVNQIDNAVKKVLKEKGLVSESIRVKGLTKPVRRFMQSIAKKNGVTVDFDNKSISKSFKYLGETIGNFTELKDLVNDMLSDDDETES